MKKETLYAYVSRGMLARERLPGERESRFDATEVARLASRTRAGGRAGRLDLVVDSGLTMLDPAGGLWYRGWDAVEASREAGFERVATWLWSVRAGSGDKPAPSAARTLVPAFEAPADVLETARRAVRALGTGANLVDRLRVAVAAAATADPLRFDRRPEAVAAAGGRIVAVLLASLEPSSAAAGQAAVGAAGTIGTVAERLWPLLCGRSPADGQAEVLDAALVLLADHEMASSTLAARVAASTWADPYLVVSAGLAALGGPLHGNVGDQLVPLLSEVAARGAGTAVAERWRLGEEVGGFGHRVYTARDPRADAVWERLQDIWPDHAIVAATDDLVATVTAHGGTFPNIDLMLAALVGCAGMREGSAEAIFAVARTAGWLAHAIEEYAHRLRFRLRAAYTGPPPIRGERLPS